MSYVMAKKIFISCAIFNQLVVLPTRFLGRSISDIYRGRSRGTGSRCLNCLSDIPGN